MKKFFEKHDLFKIAGIFLLLVVLLSWLVGSSYYQEGTLATDELSRIGLFDVTTYGLLGFYYFTVMFMFIIAVGGFYKFLGSVEAYRVMTDKMANAFKGKEKIVVAVSILLFAVLASVATDYFVVLAFIPLVITVLSKLKVDKVTGLASTFGGTLVGILASTYSSKVVGQLANESYGVGVTFGYQLLGVLVIGVIAYLLLTYFVINRISKGTNKENLLVDPFATIVEEKETKKKRKVSVLPLAIIMSIVTVLLVLAYISWKDALGVSVFSDLHKWITEATLFGQPVYSYILGSSLQEFGAWDLLAGAGVLMMAAFVIKVVYNIPFDKMLDKFAEGFKVVTKPIVVLTVIYTTLIFSVVYPTAPAIVNLIMKLGNNIFTLFVSGVVTSLFTVEMQYGLSLVGTLYSSFSNVKMAALSLQTAYGLVGFIAPTSGVLMLGLSMLDIKYKDYFKFIWKFAVALLIVVLAVLAILMYI